MTIRFTLKEPFPARGTPNHPYGIYGNGTPQYCILRLFFGNLNVYDRQFGKLIKLTHNEALQATSTRNIGPKSIIDILFEEETGITENDFTAFLVANAALNNSFYDGLISEITGGLVSKKNGRYLESFLHLYRTLEFIGIALPTIYSLIHKNFVEAHAFHKAIFSSDRDTDMKALSQFSSVLSRNNSTLENLNFVFDYSKVDADFSLQAVDEIQRSCTKSADFLEVQDLTLSLPFDKVCLFLVELRNRLFHFQLGQNNIRLEKVGGSDILLLPIIQVGYNWLFLVYSEMLRALAQNHIRTT